MPILRARDQVAQPHHPVTGEPLGRPDRPAEWPVITFWPEYGRAGMPLGMHGSHTTEAFVNDGRWMARCLYCPSAQVISEEDKRFFCPNCGNQANGGVWIKVVWPNAKTVQAIEKALLARSDRRRQNWEPGETPADLLKQNEEHGIEAVA